jgi:hypothetical protein
VPIYSAASWASIMSLAAAFYLDPLRDVYEVRSPRRLPHVLVDLKTSRPSPSTHSSSFSSTSLAANVLSS